ncbi:MAG: DUF1080 domain-containing protein [Candidatus Hydrogenedentes bacterium]|nr:DUF1080 domain-containing protein [Candidatus Hydrogenedentota bacterium]
MSIRNIAISVMLCALPLAAFAADDDGIMGNWKGAFDNPAWAGTALEAQVIATAHKDEIRTWQMILSVNDEVVSKSIIGQQLAQGGQPQGPAAFAGEASINGNTYAFGGEAGMDETMTGMIQADGDTIAFTMTRLHIESPTLGQAPPEGAIVLLDGTNTDNWIRVPEKWPLVGDGAMEVSGSQLMTIQKMGSGKYHVEFRSPFEPNDTGQARGNSGVYLLGVYEIQVLDSFGLDPADNLCGGLYSQAVPLVNACLPPLSWQTYDIDFQAAEFDADGNKTKNARITAYLNGVLIHNDLELTDNTPGGLSGDEPSEGNLMLQDHGDRVRYRNIWFVPAK